MSVLALASAPEELFTGCAGTLARWEHGGREVFVAFPGASESELEAAREAAGAVGAQLLETDSSIGRAVDERSVRDAVMDHVRRAKAEVLLTGAGTEDALSDVLFNAAFCATVPNYPSPEGVEAIRMRAPIRYFESPRSRDFAPTEYVDISEQWDVKRAAAALFGEQAVQMAETLSRARGIQGQVEFAEAFASEVVWGRISPTRQLP